jgi:hypothetical protein
MTHARSTRRLAVAALTILSLVAGASSAPAKGAKQDAKEPVRRVLVIVIARDESLRTSFEDVIAGELSLRGAAAKPSYLLFPELPQERGPVEERLKGESFDAVTVSRLVERTDKTKTIEGRPGYETDYQGTDWWGAYVYTFKLAMDPGYLEHETRVRVRTDLFRVSGTDGRPVWTGTSAPIDPHTVSQTAREVGAGVAKALAKAKLL